MLIEIASYDFWQNEHALFIVISARKLYVIMGPLEIFNESTKTQNNNNNNRQLKQQQHIVMMCIAHIADGCNLQFSTYQITVFEFASGNTKITHKMQQQYKK